MPLCQPTRIYRESSEYMINEFVQSRLANSLRLDSWLCGLSNASDQKRAGLQGSSLIFIVVSDACA